MKVALEKSKANISAALGRCSVHAEAKFESSTDGKEELETDRRHYCPYRECERTETFSKRKELRIHFRTHVECNEVCQCCAYRFRVASKFLRHTPDVSEMDTHQASYATKRRDLIVERVDEELRLAESKKRTREVTDDYAKTCKQVKLAHVDTTITSFDHGIAPSVQISLDDIRGNALPSDTLLTAAQTFHEPTTQLIESGEDMAAFEQMPNLAAYNAPVHNEINWLSWIQQTEA